MSLSEKIINKTFPHSKGNLLGKAAGYESTYVDLFLEEVATDVEKLEKENNTLKEQVRISYEEQQIKGDTAQETPVLLNEPPESSYETEDVRKRLKQIETLERSYRRIIYMAEEEAEKVKDEAKDMAKKMLLEAQNKAESLIKEANSRFDEKEREIRGLMEKHIQVKKELKDYAKTIENLVS